MDVGLTCSLIVRIWCDATCLSIRIPSQPKTNVWVTLANKTGQDTLCLSTSSPDNSFSTCLVGAPVDSWPIPKERLPYLDLNSNPFNIVNLWINWVGWLLKANLELQELDFLGSIKMGYCISFNCTDMWAKFDQSYIDPIPHQIQRLNATLQVYRNASARCNYTAPNVVLSSRFSRRLPLGYFLICKDRAWSGIPSRACRGPCSIGRLTLLTPNTSMVMSNRKSRLRLSMHAFQAN